MSAKAIRILRITLCAAVVLLVLIRLGGCVLRRTTARFEGTKLIIGGVTYVHKEFDYTGTGRTVAYVDGWTVSTIKEDPSRTFLRVSSFPDSYGYMREDFDIPTEGRITVVYTDSRNRSANDRLCETIAHLRDNPPPETFRIRTDRIYAYAKSVSVGYEDCPIATDFAGYIGIINENWIYIPPTGITYGEESEFTCHILPDEIAEILSALPHIENKTIETLP